MPSPPPPGTLRVSGFSGAHPVVASAFGLFAGTVLVVATLPREVSAGAPTIGPTIGTIGVEAIKPGMKGYGLTVFSGTEPEKFDVEVINVLHKFRPNQDLILVKTIHPRLEKVKVVAGMSGSPVFLDDRGTAKLAGAYAYGWSFGNEPVAGVTPIASMLAELSRPLSPMLLPGAGKPPLGAVPPTKKSAQADVKSTEKSPIAWNGGWKGEVGTYSIEEHLKQVAARLGRSAGAGAVGPVAVDTPLVVGGMSDRALKELGAMLAPLGLVPLQGGGAGVATVAKDAPQHYVDGGAIAVQLMRGDSAAQATGTVTHVIGKKLVGFGHPMMEVGSTHMPIAVAKILWILSSDQRSFKIGEPVRALGTLTQDRESCIVGDEDIVAPMIPLSVDILGDATAPKKKWSMEIVNDKFMSPMFAAFAFGDAVGVTINDRRDASWTLTSTIRLKGGKGELKLTDFGVSNSGVPGASAFFGARTGVAVGELLNNPFEDVVIDRIDSTLDVKWTRDTVRLRGAEILESPVEAGHDARVKLTLKPYFGPETTTIVSIAIDRALAGKDVDLEVVPGWSVVQEAASPETLGQLIHNLQLATLSPKSFVVQYRHPEQGLALKGKVAARLPGFALDALKPQMATIEPESFVSYIRASADAGGYADGTTKLRLVVKPSTK